jgi:hypothetical protein
MLYESEIWSFFARRDYILGFGGRVGESAWTFETGRNKFEKTV